jgi:hypothetical protein
MTPLMFAVATDSPDPRIVGCFPIMADTAVKARTANGRSIGKEVQPASFAYWEVAFGSEGR